MKWTLGAGIVAAGLVCASLLAQEASGKFAGQVPANFELKKGLSTRNAKAGQEIEAVVSKPTTINGVDIPRGSVLSGHVVDVTPHTRASPASSLTIVFDQLKPKKGTAFPVETSVYRIALSDGQLEARRSEKDLGGMRGTASTGEQDQMRSGSDAMSSRISSHVSANGAPVTVISMIPDVALSAAAGGEKSAILSSTKQDVDLANGTQMVVGVKAK